MTRRGRAGWLREITESGITVRVFERSPGSLLYREVRIDDTRDRKSLGHRDRKLAIDQAKALAKRLAEPRMSGYTGALSLGQRWRHANSTASRTSPRTGTPTFASTRHSCWRTSAGGSSSTTSRSRTSTGSRRSVGPGR